MDNEYLPPPGKDGIIRGLPDELSEENRSRLNKFGYFMFLYDFFQDRFVRPRIHKADPSLHHEIMRGLIAPVVGMRVLDVACGTGAAVPLFDPSNSYTGLDLSLAMLKEALKKLKRRSFTRQVLVQGNAEELLFADESFDFVLMDTSLHMIPRAGRSVEEIARVLVKDGEFACSTPAVGIDAEFDRNWRKIENKRNLHSFSEDDIKRMCSRSGLNYERVATNGGMLYFRTRKV